MNTSQRRLAVLSGQLALSGGEVEMAPISRASTAGGASTSGRGPSGPSSSSTFATATGTPSSYARVHGEPSRAPARWRRIPSVAREELTDVIYEKAEGEGIAKVRQGATA